MIERDNSGRWDVAAQAGFLNAGLTPPGSDQMAMRPVEGAIARLTEREVAVTLEVPPFATYQASVSSEVHDQIQRRGGLLFGVTHALHPHDLRDLSQLEPIIKGDRTIAGWVELEASRRRRPQVAPTTLDTTLVLHWSPGHLSVGPLIAHTNEMLGVEAAQQWAVEQIGGDEDSLLPWEPARQSSPADGWFTVDSISVHQFFLRQYPDGWRLVRALSRKGGMSTESENEARNWAANVITHRLGKYKLNWAPGPTPPDVVTLYAQV